METILNHPVLSTFVIGYLLLTLLLTIYDVMRLRTEGELLMKRKLALQGLVEAYGYSENGWNRFAEYRDFVQEYGDVVAMYKHLKDNPVHAIAGMYFTSLILPFIFVYNYLEKVISKLIAHKKRKG